MNTSIILNVRETGDETCASLDNIECMVMVRISTLTTTFVRVKRYRLVQPIDTVRDSSSTLCESKSGRTCNTSIPNNRHRRGSPRHLDAEHELGVSELAYGLPSSLASVWADLLFYIKTRSKCNPLCPGSSVSPFGLCAGCGF